MTSSDPHPPERDRGLGASSSSSWIAPLFERALDLAALERMLLALGSHGELTGFARVHLLAWNPDRASMEGRLSWRGTPGRGLAESLGRASRQASEGTDPEATRALRRLDLTAAELEGPLARAWASHQSALGSAEARRPWSGAAEIGVVPLRRGPGPFGLLVGEWMEPSASRDRAAALDALRATCNAALAAHHAWSAIRRRDESVRAIAELGRAAVSALNLAEIGNLLVRLAAQATGARGAALWRANEGNAAEARLEPMSSFGPAGTRERLGRALAPLAERALATGQLVRVERAVDADYLSPEVAAQLTTAAAVPLIAYGRGLGALVVYDRAAQHPNDGMAFDAEDLELLATLADQCAIAFEQARTDDVRRRAERDRDDMIRQLGRSERLAALGETSTRAVGEARNPLASIGAFARRVHRSLAEDDPNREYLEVILRETDRLERALAQSLPLASPEGPRFALESVNHLIQEALQRVGERLVRRRVRLLKKLSPDLPPLLLDAGRMGQVFENVLGQALERVHAGGRVRIESRRVQQFVVVDVANDGVTEPGDALAELFAPFAPRGEGGSDLGLAIARQVVSRHGGEIRVRSDAEWTLIVSLSLPIRGNEERRRPGADRRITRNDRRQRAPTT